MLVLIDLAQVISRLCVELCHCPPRLVSLPKSRGHYFLLCQALVAQLIHLALQLIAIPLLLLKYPSHLLDLPVLIGHGSFHAVLKLGVLRIIPQRELFYQLVLLLALLACHV